MADLDDFTLYEVFYEAGTMLNGVLVDLERQASRHGERALAADYRQERASLHRDRKNTRHDDRLRQIELADSWHSRRAMLESA